ncbi:LysR family transcriptional regulator [Pseudorhodoferax sp.]|uniref:LysR family transcriptional regulator n=1 Tax=Pseudorhodoferax sp. TaxID=1993553 RepID=UPI0039E60266
MNLRQLRYFAKVVETGNMTRAAAELLVAQPALGMQVRQLEEDLGVALLRRHSRGVEATPAGALLYQRACAILGLVEQTRREIASMAPDAVQAVRLGMTPSLMLAIGAALAVRVREALPHVRLSLAEEMSHVLVDQLVREELDLALAYGVPEHPAVARVALHHEDLVLVTLPGGAPRRPVALAEALEERLAIPERRDVVRETVTEAAHAAGLEVRLAYEVRSIAAIKGLVLRGEAASILPYASVISEVQAGLLDARAVVAPALRRTLYLAWPQRRGPLPHEAALVAEIRAALEDLTARLGALAHPA